MEDDSERQKILVVDEDVLTVLEAERVLRGADYVAVHLTTPAGFWAKLDYEAPDLLLIDMGMALFNTDEFLERLRADQSYEDMAVVLFSNLDANELQQLCVDHDINGYFCKSHEMSELPEFLENFF